MTKENRQKAVKLRGLPFNVTEDEICEFFKSFNIVFIFLRSALNRKNQE